MPSPPRDARDLACPSRRAARRWYFPSGVGEQRVGVDVGDVGTLRRDLADDRRSTPCTPFRVRGVGHHGRADPVHGAAVSPRRRSSSPRRAPVLRGHPGSRVAPSGTLASLVPTMKTGPRGRRATSSLGACCGQFEEVRRQQPARHAGVVRRAARLRWSAVSWPSDGPSDPASESPPIQSRSGCVWFSGARHVCAAAVPATGALVGTGRDALATAVVAGAAARR